MQPGARVLDEALKAGIEIPHSCYHPALTVVGSCRMCLVEIEGQPKLQTACSVQVSSFISGIFLISTSRSIR